MARPSDEFMLAWSSLSGGGCSRGWQVISLSPTGSVDVQAGRRSPDNLEAVLFSFPVTKLSRTEKLPEGRGFLVEKVDVTDSGRLCVALTRQTTGNSELFVVMVCDVVGAMDGAVAAGASESRLLRVLVGRVNAWQHFMSKGSTSLDTEAELGLAGEVYVMMLLLDSGAHPDSVLKGWVGPDDAPQDFLLGGGAIEVKATMSTSGFPVKIGSLEQLDDAVASPLFLAAVRFAVGDGGQTLPEMIADLAQRLDSTLGETDLFREKLLAAGYLAMHEAQYTRKFKPQETRILFVSEGFPRLTPGSVPAGMTRALYEINLDHARRFATNLGAALLKLGADR